MQCLTDPLDAKGACLTCQKVLNMTIRKFSCLRWKITDVSLFKPGQVIGLPLTRRWLDSTLVDIPTWASSDKKTIQTTEGYGSRTVTLEVREFVPIEGDVLHRHWWAASVKKEVLMPPYALAHVDAATQAYKDYISQSSPDFFKEAARSKMDWHFRDTYNIAIETSVNPHTVSTCLKDG